VTDIQVPHNGWLPRWHQTRLWRYLEDGGKRAMAIWHRRAGKDEVGLHWAAVCAVTRPANYVHSLPEFEQGRRTIWSSVNPHSGKRRIDEAFPLDMREATNEQSMSIRMRTGATWAVIGSDRYDTSLVGTSVAGITFSEWALSNPSAWAYARPTIEENNGWAIFISTPRGRNHCWDMYKHAQSSPDWFCELLTAEDTEALTREQLAEAQREYCALYGRDMGMAQYRQEYLCDWQASVLGSFYAFELAAVRSEGRVVEIEPPPGTPVSRSWDLGVGHSTSIWMFCAVGSQLYILDHLVASGVGLDWYADTIERLYAERGWTHGTDFVPHDAKVREFGSGRTRVETMQRLGLNPMLAPDATLEDGRNAVRRTLPLCVFHPRCDEGDLPGLGGLEKYRREWDDEKKTFKKSAVEDWTTDISDSFRYLSLSWRLAPLLEVKPPPMTGWRIPPPDETIRKGIQL
jgi:phage terminase large subunit